MWTARWEHINNQNLDLLGIRTQASPQRGAPAQRPSPARARGGAAAAGCAGLVRGPAGALAAAHARPAASAEPWCGLAAGGRKSPVIYARVM